MNDAKASRREELVRVKALMALRVMVITLFLGSVVILFARKGQVPATFPYIVVIVFVYILTIFYALSLPRIRNYTKFAYLQVVVDLFTVTGVVYFTGGVDSVFSFLYILAIIAASIILERRHCYLIASTASILFGVLVNLEFYHVIQHYSFFLERIPVHPEGYTFFTVFSNIAAFYIVAFLSGHLSYRLRKTGAELAERNFDLRELKRFHENVVENMNTGLVTTQLDGRINSLNRAAVRITGYQAHEVLWRPCIEIFPLPKLKELFIQRDDYDRELSAIEGYITRKDGSRAFIVMNASLLRDEQDAVKGVIASFQDLTELKEIEEKMKRADRLTYVGALAAGVAHEIRNPLASISGSIEVLRENLELDETNQRLMDIALKETDRLNSTITQFLNYARPMPAKKEIVNLNDLITEVVDLLEHHHELRQDVEIVATSGHREVYCLADPREVRQVLWNLCLNSLQAMEGEGRLALSTDVVVRENDFMTWRRIRDSIQNQESRSPNDGADFVKIVVADTGKGIPEADRERIFDPFVTTREDGVGLGLSIAYKTVESHDGTIEVQSAVGRGTKMTIYLPMAQPALSSEEPGRHAGESL